MRATSDQLEKIDEIAKQIACIDALERRYIGSAAIKSISKTTKINSSPISLHK
jgi:hypothetical protein